LCPDAFALLSYTAEAAAGTEGWPVAEGGGKDRAATKSSSSSSSSLLPYAYPLAGFYLLDVALAAARRAFALDPLSGAACKQIGKLLAMGAVDRYRYDERGRVVVRDSVHLASNIRAPTFGEGEIPPPLSSLSPSGLPDGSDLEALGAHIRRHEAYESSWSAVRGSPRGNPSRVRRARTQLLRCVMTCADALLNAAFSDEAVSSLEQDMEDASAMLAELRSQGEAGGGTRKTKAGGMDAGAVFSSYPAQRTAAAERAAILASLSQEERLAEDAEGVLPLYVPVQRRSKLAELEESVRRHAAAESREEEDDDDNDGGVPSPTFVQAYAAVSTLWRKRMGLDAV
jgi:hypothetical protein